MAKKDNDSATLDEYVEKIKQLDATFTQIVKDSERNLHGTDREDEMNKLVNQYNDLVSRDAFNFTRNKNISQSSYTYLANILVGNGNDLSAKDKGDSKKVAQRDAVNRAKLNDIFSNGTDMQMAGYFLNQSSDIYYILDEIESVCAYMYQLEEAVLILRDNILNNEQTVTDLPFDITFDGVDTEKLNEYKRIAIDTFQEANMKQKVNDHIVPKALKFGRYYVLSIPYSEIGTTMLNMDKNKTHSLFSFGGKGFHDMTSGISESNSEEKKEDEDLKACMENVDALINGIFENCDPDVTSKLGDKESLTETIKYNIEHLLISEEATPPNVTGIAESSFQTMAPDLQREVKQALINNEKKFSMSVHYDDKLKKQGISPDGIVAASTSDDIPGCFIKLVDPRQMCPIKMFDHKFGYYYFENYDYARLGTSITDILSNQVNFNDQNLVIDNLVGTILKKLKYGELVRADDDFKALVLNCILYSERRNNPIRIKFVPCDYVTEFNVNKDENGNGQSILLKTLLFARLYISLLMFDLTAIFTKSTDTEFYYFNENAITPSFEDQVADVIEQMRNSNIDLSSIINGNLMHGNRAINKRYFMSTGTADNRPFTVDIVSGQTIDIHSDLLTDLRKMAIGASGIPAVAVDYMDELEFATVIKMTNTKTLTRANNLQIDLNGDVGDGLTGLMIKLIKFNKPGSIPDEDLIRCRCVLRKNNTINNNISQDEIGNVTSTVEAMVDTFYGGGTTEPPEIVEFRKEQMKRKMTMLMASSLPWSEMDRLEKEVNLDAEQKRLLDKFLKAKAEAEANTQTE